VRYAETDQMGVVYYANYFVWFEVARTDLLRRAGWTYREMEATGFVLPVIEAHCDYTQPARYDDELDIETTGALLSPVRVRFDYRVLRATDASQLATGHTVHASLDPAGRPRRLPAQAQAVFATPFAGA
jgi:acyl-CoA thioester hydrolase